MERKIARTEKKTRRAGFPRVSSSSCGTTAAHQAKRDKTMNIATASTINAENIAAYIEMCSIDRKSKGAATNEDAIDMMEKFERTVLQRTGALAKGHSHSQFVSYRDRFYYVRDFEANVVKRAQWLLERAATAA